MKRGASFFKKMIMLPDNICDKNINCYNVIKNIANFIPMNLL